MARDDWPINEMPCDYEGCEDTGTSPCFYTVYRRDYSVFQIFLWQGARAAWQFWRDGCVDILEGYYCAEHAYKEGFCWACGIFYAGASERFDFGINGQWLCDGCWSNFYEYESEEEEDYYPGPWDD